MAFNYAENYSDEIVEVINQEALCSPFVTDNVRWLDAKTFHFTQLSTSGYKNHNRKGGWNKGEVAQTDVAFTLKHDRDISFLVDKADVDETNQTASVEKISKVFEQTQAVPELDALFFSKVAQEAQKVDGCHSETAISSYTKSNVYSKLKKMIGGRLKLYKSKGALVAYVCTEIMDLLEQSDAFTRKIEMCQIADGGVGIETRITSLDGVVLIEAIDDERFYDQFDFETENGGFEPAVGAHKINILIASPITTKVVPKINDIYLFEPGAHTEGSGYLYQNRSLSDCFTFPNGKDGKIDSIYVDVDTATYSK